MTAAPSSSWPRNGSVVLVIDDEPIVLATVRRMLEDTGYGVLVGASGSEGLNAARNNGTKPDIALLDLSIGDMSADNVAAELRQSQPGIRILLTSGYPLDTDSPELQQTGADGFVQKPFTMARLQQKLNELLAAPRE